VAEAALVGVRGGLPGRHMEDIFVNARQQFVIERTVKAGLHPMGGAAIVGNGCGESGVNLDSTFDRVHANYGSGGFLEWRDSAGAPRKTRLAAFADAHQTDRNDLGIQVDYAIWEIGKYFPWLDEQLRDPGTRTVETLTTNFCDIFENPAPATAGVANRIAHAVAALADWNSAQRAPRAPQAPTEPVPQLPAPSPPWAPPAPVPAASPASPASPAQAPWVPVTIPASTAGHVSAILDQLIAEQTAYRQQFPTPFDTAIESLQKLGRPGSSNQPPPLQIPAAKPVAPLTQRYTVMDSISPQVTAVIRNVLIFAGGIAVSKGWLDNTTMVAVVGGVISIGGAAWSAFGHTKPSIIAAAAALPEVQKVVTTTAIADSPQFAANNRVVSH
jgi:hypothetical protein